MLRIFGNPMSTCTRKVLMTLHENGTQYEFTNIDFTKGEHKQPAYLAHQPFGQLPALDDDGFGLYESRAMARYVNEKAGGKLVPSDPKAHALMEEWISIETSNFTPHAMKFIYHHTLNSPQQPAVLEAAGAGLEKALTIMNQRLAKSPFLAGNEFTLADICFMPYIEYAMGTPVKETFAGYPHVSSWWKKVSERPAWGKATGRA